MFIRSEIMLKILGLADDGAEAVTTALMNAVVAGPANHNTIIYVVRSAKLHVL